jgi:copper(I)-binding protein
LVITACSGEGGLVVVDAWARPTPEVADSAAFYVSLSNDGPDVVLEGAQAAICETTALHDSVLEDGVMEMRPVDTIAVGGGDDLVMEPGGLHLMCFGLGHQLMENEEIEVSLLLEDNGAVTAAVSVEDR